jgi:hypothetical protein
MTFGLSLSEPAGSGWLDRRVGLASDCAILPPFQQCCHGRCNGHRFQSG